MKTQQGLPIIFLTGLIGPDNWKHTIPVAARSGSVSLSLSLKPCCRLGAGCGRKPVTRFAQGHSAQNDRPITFQTVPEWLRPGKWCNFPVFERRIVDVRSHRGMVSE